MRPRTPEPPFTSRLETREAVFVLAYLPVHLVLMQLVCGYLFAQNMLTEAQANFLYYAVGFVYMLVFAFRFLRRDFDPLADHPFTCLRTVVRGLLLMYFCDYLLVLLFESLLPAAQSPNDAALQAALVQEAGLMRAELVYLTPLVEEMLFRAGIFGLLRRKNRLVAYLVSSLCFCLYHVAPYAVQEPVYWLFLLQYLPVSLLLARCYERCNTIWAPIFFHAAVNAIAVSVILL